MRLKSKRIIFWLSGTVLLIVAACIFAFKVNINPAIKVGQVVDSFNGVNVYYNGAVGNVLERHVTKDGYNLGLKYQCVEFIKRYYYEFLHHKMPDSYGHAKDFFDPSVSSGAISPRRALVQYHNGVIKPKVNDIVVFDGSLLNPYGHVAIVSRVFEHELEIIQQNPGPFGSSRETINLQKVDGGWKIDRSNVLGLLRLP